MNTPDRHTVVVTRPSGQADHLVGQLRTLGVNVIRLPTIDIQFRRQPLTSQEHNHLDQSALWIFTSTNAVTGSSRLGALKTSAQVKIATIGLSTSKSLKKFGINPDYVPDRNSDSEGLLKLLNGAIAPSSTVTIVRGGQGRDTLQRQLAARGNTVHTLDVYQRLQPQPEQDRKSVV